jgi:hypothetical protein
VMKPKPFCVLNHLTCGPDRRIRRRAATADARLGGSKGNVALTGVRRRGRSARAGAGCQRRAAGARSSCPPSGGCRLATPGVPGAAADVEAQHRGPCSGDHGPPAQTASRQPRAPCPASWRQPSSLAGLVATPAWSADLNQVVRFFATSPRPPRAPCAPAGSMAAPESMLDVPDSASFSFPAEARPAAAETLGRAAARCADARRAAGGAHPGVLGRDQGV